MSAPPFSRDVLRIDAAGQCSLIERTLADQVFQRLRRKGVVVGLSGGIDSSVTAALCARALGPERVLGLFLPERESSPESLPLARALAAGLRIEFLVEDITPLLEAAGCYRKRDEAIRRHVPQYGEGYRCKVVLSSVLEHHGFKFFSLVVESGSGERTVVRLDARSYPAIVASTSMKQRARTFYQYYHADRLRYAVAGTANRVEYELGFFVKNGDSAADVSPLARLYKSQVYQLAAHLEIPPEIQKRTPTTDTYPLEQSQEEFYFSLPHQLMDLCLHGRDHGVPPDEAAGVLGLTPEQVTRIYRDIDQKRLAARYLHAPPLLVGEGGA